MLFPYQDVQPDSTSQTTSVRIENLVMQESNHVAVFDDDPHVFIHQTQERSIWDKTTRQVLQEYAELWERLSKL